MEIEADRPKVPDAENAALHIIAVRRTAGIVSVTGVPKYDRIFDKLPPNVQLNLQQSRLIRGELAKIAKPLVEARKLKDMPSGRFPITYSDDFIATLIPDHQNARLMADWLPHDAFELAQDQDCDGALESCQALLNAGGVFKHETFLISLLIRVAMQDIAVAALERVLAQGEPSEAALAATQAMLEREMNSSGWLQAIRGERAGIHHLFDNLRSGKIQNTQMLRGLVTGRGASNFQEWITDQFPSTMLHSYPEHLKRMTRCVEIAKLPIHERGPKMKEWEDDSRQSRNVIVRLLYPALTKCHQAECRSQALLRTSSVAMACERYRQRHDGQWPASLEALVNEKLIDNLPLDPLDGQPLRYRKTKYGVVIYSIGMDLTDNQGNVDREHPINPGVDLGFRLWDPELRRQNPLPPVALQE
jgi:hypothetical protein